MDESMFDGGGNIGDRFNDEDNDESFDGFQDAMNQPFSLSGSLGFGSQNSSGFLGSDAEDISQGYFAALSQNTLNVTDADLRDDGDVNVGEEEDEDEDEGGEIDLMYFDADNGDGSMLLPAKPSLVPDDGGHQKTIRFADDVVFANEYDIMGSMEGSGGLSEGSFELFGGDDSNRPNSSKILNDSDAETETGSLISDEDDDDDDVDSVKEEERKIMRSMMFAGFGAGFFAFVGWGVGKLLNRTRSNDVAPEDFVQGAEQVVQTAGAQGAGDAAFNTASEVAVQGADASQNAFNASMTASQGNMSSFAGAPITPNPAMAAQQVQVMQTMAVNAASNAASSAASASTALAGAATGMGTGAAAGTFAGISTLVAGTTIATKVALAVGVTSVIAVSSGVGVRVAGMLDESLQPSLMPSVAPSFQLSSVPSFSPSLAEEPATIILPDLVEGDDGNGNNGNGNSGSGNKGNGNSGNGNGGNDAGDNKCPGTHKATATFQFTISDLSEDLASWIPLSAIFVSAYNSASRRCREKYKRYIDEDGASTVVTFPSGSDIVARFEATVHCTGPCPDEPLFGDTIGGRRLKEGVGTPIDRTEFLTIYHILVEPWHDREKPSDSPTKDPSAAPTTPGPTFQPSASPSSSPSPPPSRSPSSNPTEAPISPGDSGCESFPCGENGRDLFCKVDSGGLSCDVVKPANAICGCCDGEEFQPNCVALVKAEGGDLTDCCVPIPSASPSTAPSTSPSAGPTDSSSANPTGASSDSPTVTSSANPTSTSSVSPTETSSATPTDTFSASPTDTSSASPTDTSSASPSVGVSASPTAATVSPSTPPSGATQTNVPSALPSTLPSTMPSTQPTVSPSAIASTIPSIEPSATPSGAPSEDLSTGPTTAPSGIPSATPSESPSTAASSIPSQGPSSNQPSSSPSLGPTGSPSGEPSTTPSDAPTAPQPSEGPSTSPSTGPTVGPTVVPTTGPTLGPTTPPTGGPTAGPTIEPTSGPTVAPTVGPTLGPTIEPTTGPTLGPTVAPTSGPTLGPTVAPTSGPTLGPTVAPPTSSPTTSCGTTNGGATVSGNSVTILVTNESANQISLHDSSFYWDVGTNGGLVRITFDGDELWDSGGSPVTAQPFNLDNSNMDSTVKRLAGGASKELVFVFENNAAANGYDFSLECNGSCGVCVAFAN